MDDHTIAHLVLATYDLPDVPPVTWTLKAMVAGIDCRIWESPTGEQLIAFRGSDDRLDWIRDFFTLPHTPTDHPLLGPVHAGASLGIAELIAYLAGMNVLLPNPYVAGHSLGAMRASIFAGELVSSCGITPKRIVTFGAPRCGFQKLTDILSAIPVGAYRNGTGAMRSDGASFDLITDAIPTIPIMLPYVRIREPQIDVSAPPLPGDTIGPFAWHHMPLYAGVV